MIVFLNCNYSSYKSICYALYDFSSENNLKIFKKTKPQLEYIINNFLTENFKHELIDQLYQILINKQKSKDKELGLLSKILKPYLVPFLKQQYL